jgi:hypothetical protein
LCVEATGACGVGIGPGEGVAVAQAEDEEQPEEEPQPDGAIGRIGVASSSLEFSEEDSGLFIVAFGLLLFIKKQLFACDNTSERIHEKARQNSKEKNSKKKKDSVRLIWFGSNSEMHRNECVV